MRFKKCISLLIAFLFILFPASCGNESNEDTSGEIILSRYKSSITGTAEVTKEGVVLNSDARTASFTYLAEKPESLNKKGIFVLTLLNTTSVKELEISFITDKDKDWTSFKSFKIPIESCKEFKEFSIDLSGTYGWISALSGVKVSAEGISEGNIKIKSFRLKDGGEHYLKNLEFSEPEVYVTSKERVAKGILVGPDGILGSWKSEGVSKFIGCADGKPFVTEGTAEDPFQKVVYTGGLFEGVDWTEYRYCSVAQVLKEPTTGMLIGITHLERNLYSKDFYAATIGLSVSKDDGDNWKFLGEIICQNMPLDVEPQFSRDIGNGTIVTDNEYLYIYCADVKNGEKRFGMSVSRIKLTDLYESMLGGKLPPVSKYKNGKWDEPGWCGDFDNILPDGISPNFCYVTHNNVLNKYIMVLCQSPYYRNNDGDLILLVSESPVDWENAEYQYIAASKEGEQYPTILSLEENMQTESGREFYLYYCSWNALDEKGNSNWQLLWATAKYMRQKITVTK